MSSAGITWPDHHGGPTGQHRPEKRGRQPVDEDRQDEHRSSTESANAEAVRGGETALPPLQGASPACGGMCPNTWIGQSPQQNCTRTLRPIGESESQPILPPIQYEHLQMPQSAQHLLQQTGASNAGRSPIDGTPTAASVAAAAASAAATPTAGSTLPSAVNGVAYPGQVMGSITLPLLNLGPYPVPMQDILASGSSPLQGTSPLAAARRPIGETPDTPRSGASTGHMSGISHDGVGVATNGNGAAFFGAAPAGAACCFGVSSDGVGTIDAAQPLSSGFGGVTCAPVGQLTLADPAFMPAVLGSAHASVQALAQQQQELLAQVQVTQELGSAPGQHIGVTMDANGALPGGQAVQPCLQQHCQPGEFMPLRKPLDWPAVGLECVPFTHHSSSICLRCKDNLAWCSACLPCATASLQVTTNTLALLNERDEV